jgi:hypothetical protein
MISSGNGDYYRNNHYNPKQTAVNPICGSAAEVLEKEAPRMYYEHHQQTGGIMTGAYAEKNRRRAGPGSGPAW